MRYLPLKCNIKQYLKPFLLYHGSVLVGTTRAMSGCISSQASEGVCHCATICTRFSGRLNPLTPQFLIKITLGVISRKRWEWRSEGLREGQVSSERVWIERETPNQSSFLLGQKYVASVIPVFMMCYWFSLQSNIKSVSGAPEGEASSWERKWKCQPHFLALPPLTVLK